MMRPLAVCLSLFAALAALPAQQRPELLTEARVRDAIGFLASDELLGRDTPSPGLTKAAEWIADRFAKAGLERVVKDSWQHTYLLPGLLVDGNAVTATVKLQIGDKQEGRETRELQAGKDIRLLQPGTQNAESEVLATVALQGDPRYDQLLALGGGRRPILVEVEPESGQWQAAGAVRQLLGVRRQGARPVFLVRKGVLPGGPLDPRFEDRRYTLTYELPTPEKIDIELPNVVGVLRGSSKPDEYVMVSAHFDHIGVRAAVHGDAICNGADDDASGTTAVVLLAEALAQGPKPARSILFVCFSGEEKGLRGSAAFAEQPPVPLAKVVVDINVEMIGRPEPGKQKQAWITGVDYSDFAAIAAPALQKAGVELVPFGMQRQLFAASDNFSLVQKGVVAHSISAGSLHADYHQPSDEVQKIDIPHMTAVIRGLAALVWECAERPVAPAWNDAGRKVVESAARRR